MKYREIPGGRINFGESRQRIQNLRAGTEGGKRLEERGRARRSETLEHNRQVLERKAIVEDGEVIFKGLVCKVVEITPDYSLVYLLTPKGKTIKVSPNDHQLEKYEV
jgi:hypothetical protein